ncbi:hypothetical protein Q4603_11510 [Zobellia galactanivorans]|uniref:Uncharacterized protein n=2 Tax=Zobellia TaxID=112040 RepID=G0L509_ZOBGA|nr:hypothetical protein [Zobellia galactanivorans]MBU3026613.1 hypothetical protein [Zobellia galactanivorans]MDO6809245.1 hypothetical protein [Zobellia galactanivorans]CAZ95882.1 Putative protein [Zobellia galactanivorans]
MGMFLFWQDVSEIEKKIEAAPDNAYEIGLTIGTYLPFVVLALVAYALYYFSKKSRKD